MERGVVVGGLMICGSFLLAAMLNRSAMEEVAEPVLQVPAETLPSAVAPIVGPAAAPSATDCTEASASVDAKGSVTRTDPPAADLMVNGPDPCPR